MDGGTVPSIEDTIVIFNKLQELLADDNSRIIMVYNETIIKNTIYLICEIYKTKSSIVINNIYSKSTDTYKSTLITAIGLHQIYDHCINNINNDNIFLMLMYLTVVKQVIYSKLNINIF
jgi:hypothetical protein